MSDVLSGVALNDVIALTQEQLDTACGDQETTLPPGLMLQRICSDRPGGK